MRTSPERSRRACEDRLEALAAPEELDARARAELDAHLEACAGCRQAAAELRETEALLRGAAFEPDPLSAVRFTAQTTNRAEARRDRSVAALWWFLTRPQRWATSFSAAALAASVALFVGGRTTPPGPVPVAQGPVAAARAPALEEAFDDEWIPGSSASLDEETLAALSDDEAAGETSLDDAFEELSDEDIRAISAALEQG